MALPAIQYEIRSKDKSQQGVDSAVHQMGRVETGAQKLSRFVFGGATMLASIALAGKKIADYGEIFLELGSRAEETRSKFNVVFRGISEEAGAWVSDFTQDLGRSQQQFESYLATFQDTFVPLGYAREQAFEFSKTLVKLGADLSSFQNEAEKETMERLQSGIVGNVEVFRKWGVIINQTRLNQELLNMGVMDGVKAATEAQKAQARLNLLLQGTADAQGDAARTADSYANRMRRAASIIENIGTKIGETVLPIASNLLGLITEKVLQPISDWITENQERILNFFLRLPEIISVVGETMKERFTEVFTIEGIRERLEKVGEWVVEMIKAVDKIIGEFLNALGETIVAPFAWAFLAMARGIQDAFSTVINFIIDGLNETIDIINNIVNKVDSVREAIFKLFSKEAIRAAREELEKELPTGREREILLGAGIITLPTEEEILKAAGFVALGEVGKIKEFVLEDPIKVPEFQTVVDLIEDAWKEVGIVSLEAFQDAGDANADLVKASMEWIETLRDKIAEIIGQPLPEGFSLTPGAPPPGAPAPAPEVPLTGPAFGPGFAVPGAWTARPSPPLPGPITLPSWVSNILSGKLPIPVQEFKTPFEKMIDAITGFPGTLRERFSKIPEIVSGAIGRALSTGVQQFADRLGKAVEDLTPKEETRAKVFAASQGLANIVGKVISFFVDIVKGTEAYQKAIQSLRERLTALAEGPVQKLITRMGALREVTDRFMTGLGTFFDRIFGTIGTAIEKNVSAIGAIGDLISAGLNFLANIIIRLEPFVSGILKIVAPIVDALRILFEAFTPGPGEEPGFIFKTIQALGNVIVVVVSFLEAFAGKLSGIVQFLGNVVSNPLRPRTWGENIDWGPSLSEIIQENLGLTEPIITEAGAITGGAVEAATITPGGAVTVVRPPDQTFIFQIQGELMDLEGSQASVVSISRLVEIIQNAVTSDVALLVTPQVATA